MNVIPATEYADEIRKRLGGHVRQVVLFGSQARGDAREGSDYDFLVVVDQRPAKFVMLSWMPGLR